MFKQSVVIISVSFMKKLNFIIYSSLALSILSCSKKQTVLPPFVPITEPAKVYTFETTPAWSDEFNTDGAPDPGKWGYDVGGSGWGNHELEYYTNTTNNASITNGILSITAKKESMGGMNYTSSRMVSKTPADMLYGRIEVKAQLPSGKGTWPAIWMLPNDYAYGSWPNSGSKESGRRHAASHRSRSPSTSMRTASCTSPPRTSAHRRSRRSPSRARPASPRKRSRR